MKDYYSYVRPMSVNKPWNIEKLPLGNSILELAESKVGKDESLTYKTKLVDDHNLSVGEEGVLKLPTSNNYLITYSLNIRSKGEMVRISVVDQSNNVIDTISSPVPNNEFITISKTSVIKSGVSYFSLINSTGSSIEVSNGVVIISRLD